MHFLLLGRSVGLYKSPPKIRCLELGGPVPQHHCRGAWKQHGYGINMVAMEIEEDKIDMVVKIERKRGKREEHEERLKLVLRVEKCHQ